MNQEINAFNKQMGKIFKTIIFVIILITAITFLFLKLKERYDNKPKETKPSNELVLVSPEKFSFNSKIGLKDEKNTLKATFLNISDEDIYVSKLRVIITVNEEEVLNELKDINKDVIKGETFEENYSFTLTGTEFKILYEIYTKEK